MILDIAPGVAIPAEELTFTASRSGGPGGQHVNKTSTKVTLSFDLAGTRSLTGWQKRRVRSRLRTQVSREGLLRVVAQSHRSQSANREAAMERFVLLLRAALTPAKPRRPTRVPLAARRARREAKRRRGEIKRGRSGRFLDRE